MKIHKMMLMGRAVGRNEIDRIESLCKEALARDPHDYFALQMLADTFWRNGMYEKALPFALQTLEITPNDFCALRVVVHAYRERGDDQTAYPYAKRLCKATPHTLEGSVLNFVCKAGLKFHCLQSDFTPHVS